MNPGLLNRRITILRPTRSASELGAPVETWTTEATVWARYQVDKGGEKYTGAEELARREVTFTIRHRSGITPSMRIQFAGQLYNINAVLELGLNEFLQLPSTTIEEGNDRA